MMPSITATTNAIAEVTYNNLESGSFSDNGSSFEECDTYFPLIEGNEVIDSTYNSSFMEEDGNYEDLLSGLSFEYSDLTSELAPPATCTMVVVLVFDMVLQEGSIQSWNVLQWRVDWTMITLKGLLLIPTNMPEDILLSLVNLVVRLGQTSQWKR